MFDKFITWFLERVIYKVILLLNHRFHYKLPLETSENYVFSQNVVVNIITIGADYICAIIVWIGLSQRILTYVGLLTMAMYTFSEQYIMYMEDYDKLRNPEYVCEIRQRRNRYMKRYTPNLGNALKTGIVAVVLLILAVIEGLNMYSLNDRLEYYIFIILLSVYLLWIKTKYCFLDTFAIQECVFKRVNRGE